MPKNKKKRDCLRSLEGKQTNRKIKNRKGEGELKLLDPLMKLYSLKIWWINLVSMVFFCIPHTQCHGKRLASYDDRISLNEVGTGGINIYWVDTMKKKSKNKF